MINTKRSNTALEGRPGASSADRPAPGSETWQRFTPAAKGRHYAQVIWSYVTRRHELPYLPEDVAIEITNVCNFKCSFCPQSDPDHHRFVPKSYLSPQQAETILRRLRSAGVRTNVIHWTHDGDAFVNKRFHEICEVGARFGFTSMYFATNGMLCTPDRLDQLPRGECSYIFTIDFSADEQTFETVRGTRGSWARVKSNINEILTNDAYEHIAIEVREITSFSTNDLDTIKKREAELAEMFPKSPRLSVFSKKFHNACGFLPAKSSSPRYHLCPYPWTSLSIASNGAVVACSRDLRRQTVAGNILHQELDEIWNSREMWKMRKNLINKKPDLNGACAGCDMPYRSEKFSVKNVYRTLRGRFRIFAHG